MGGPTHTPKYGVDTQTKSGLPNLAKCGLDAEVTAIPMAASRHVAATATRTRNVRITTYLGNFWRRGEEASDVRDHCWGIRSNGYAGDGDPRRVLLSLLADRCRVSTDGIDQNGPPG